jgi:lipopolysaccharide transport system ATP-binding protein
MRGKYVALRDVLTNILKSPFKFLIRKTKAMAGVGTKEEFWALKNVNFTVNKGEVVGIIGHNGAGKSTLLKILSQITPPTEGEITLTGRVGSLLEVGTGFHPELTGRENIFLNGAILGMSQKEIAGKFDQIVEFSGVEKFLDTPVKYYSSGMYVRLAFAVAAHMEPDILIIDEVLAVGDAEFQKKCLGKMDEITKKEGRTILFVSHNMPAIKSLCQKCIVLEAGMVKFIGPTEEAINNYLKSSEKFFGIPIKDRRDRTGEGPLRFTDCKFIAEDGSNLLLTGRPFTIRLNFDINPSYDEIKNVSLSLSINDGISGSHLLVFWSETSANFNLNKNQKTIELRVHNCPLSGGEFYINLYCTVYGTLSDYVINATRVRVNDDQYFKGSKDNIAHPKYVVDHDWILK